MAKLPTKQCPQMCYIYTSFNGHSDSTTSMGSLFQCLTTPSLKKFFLTTNLNLLQGNLRLFLLVLSLAAWEKRQTLK